MFKNFFTLNRHVLELNKTLRGFTLIQAFTQEKNKLVLCFTKNYKELFVEINTDPSIPYLIIKQKFQKAKKNTLNFFTDYLPSALLSVKIAEIDRIINFQFENFSIYFYIHGHDTNVFLIDKLDNLLTFKKISNEFNLFFVAKLNYVDHFLKPQLNFDPVNFSVQTTKKLYPFLGKEIILEFNRRINQKPNLDKKYLFNEILNEIETNKPFIYFDDNEMPCLSFFSNSFATNKAVTHFDVVDDAIKFYISQLSLRERDLDFIKSFVSNLEKKINQLEKKQNIIEERIRAGSKYQIMQRKANILLLHKDKLKPGLTSIELEDIENGKPILIDLNPKLKPQENIEHYFTKAKEEQKEYEKLKELLVKIENELNELREKLARGKSITHIGIENNFSNSSNVKKKKSKESINKQSQTKFREFMLYNKYSILIGKDSKSNDMLTMTVARPNDYWFHARSVSGSHVLLKWDKSLGEIQKSILEKVASIAAFYSKAKTSGLVPVSYTQKKYVVKRKGMEPGKVALLKEKVIIVKPEIPSECTRVTKD